MPEASCRAAALRSAVDTPGPSIGITSVVKSAMIASTTSSSSIVTPRAPVIVVRVGSMRGRGASAQARNVLLDALAAFLAVRAERDDLERRALRRGDVAVLVVPRVLRQRRLLPVRAVPVRGAGRRAHQRLQALLGRRVAAQLELVEVERLGDLADLDLGGVGLGLLAA